MLHNGMTLEIFAIPRYKSRTALLWPETSFVRVLRHKLLGRLHRVRLALDVFVGHYLQHETTVVGHWRTVYGY